MITLQCTFVMCYKNGESERRVIWSQIYSNINIYYIFFFLIWKNKCFFFVMESFQRLIRIKKEIISEIGFMQRRRKNVFLDF